MGFEKFDYHLKVEPKTEAEKTAIRERVEKLREFDNKYQDSVEAIAYKEKGWREHAEARGMSQELVEEFSDIHSNEVLSTMESDNEKFRDSLTGLLNKRALIEDGQKIFSLELRGNKNFVVLMLDFDKFKDVNDQHGHRAGDVALKTLAAIIDGSVRNSDFTFRYGGEEFAIILPDTTLGEGFNIAEKIRNKVKSTAMELPGVEKKLKKTVSIGCFSTEQLPEWVKALDEAGETTKRDKGKAALEKNMEEVLNKVFDCADIALYNSKKNGRNQTTIYNELLKGKEASETPTSSVAGVEVN